ncbi:hypothetical protein F3Y22_tig00117034pilonHSYRG01176 [Hibiscus syriacus]|uniref:Reverse transcriptase domain-containing protein n=1 Tax=Hibiscus syriacus TaxID=106335 RepID=A0A6A2WDF2_HIBSY|nr:hypothetical protein F3Y22_tig00117034pilonHSYRG01176 [Hibiscus syriacus]
MGQSGWMWKGPKRQPSSLGLLVLSWHRIPSLRLVLGVPYFSRGPPHLDGHRVYLLHNSDHTLISPYKPFVNIWVVQNIHQIQSSRPCTFSQPTSWFAFPPCANKHGLSHDALATPWQTFVLLVHIHDIPIDFMSSKVAKVMGDFIGYFLEYDSSSTSVGYRRVMRIRVRVDIRVALKRKKKLILSNGKHHFVRFEYDRPTFFCFLCGILGHGESYYPLHFTEGGQDLQLGLDASLRVPPSRAAPNHCRLLRGEGSDAPSFSPIFDAGFRGSDYNHPFSRTSIQGQSMHANNTAMRTNVKSKEKDLPINAIVDIGRKDDTSLQTQVPGQYQVPQTLDPQAPISWPATHNEALMLEHSGFGDDPNGEMSPLYVARFIPVYSNGCTWRFTSFYGAPELAIDKRLGIFCGTVPEKLKIVSYGFDRLFKTIKREKKFTVIDLQKRNDFLSNQRATDDIPGELLDTKISLNAELDKEELYWEQRARANWLKNGDRNTSFFHRFASKRRRKNRIQNLVTEDGVQHEDDAEIRNIAMDYFLLFFSSTGTADPLDILENMDRSRAVMRILHRESVGCFEVHESFEGVRVLRGEFPMSYINHTHIFRIPKLVLPRCIDEAQGAFVPGCLITDNVIAAYEILRSFQKHRVGKNDSFALKLDMSKASDRVKWSFLKDAMRKLGFSITWITKIMNCLSTVSYSVGINGVVSDRYLPSRGLRQGCPLSPYLFLLCGEGLSSLFGRALHLASPEGAQNLKTLLQLYANCSGQLMNFEKSHGYFSTNVPANKDKCAVRTQGWNTNNLSAEGKEGIEGFNHEILVAKVGFKERIVLE